MNIAEKLATIAENQQKVFDAGKKAFYDEFWDNYQSFGNKTDYRYAFANGSYTSTNFSWNEKTFRPKYDIKPTVSVDRMFGFNSIKDLEAHLVDCGVVLDTSNCTNMSYMFLNSENVVIPTISLESAASCANLFAYAPRVTTIRKIIFGETNTNYTSAFVSCNKLENVEAGGTIPVSISFANSPLTKDSITSIVNALSNSASGQTATFKKTAKELAFTTDEWSTLIATKPNWTFSLA